MPPLRSPLQVIDVTRQLQRIAAAAEAAAESLGPTGMQGQQSGAGGGRGRPAQDGPRIITAGPTHHTRAPARGGGAVGGQRPEAPGANTAAGWGGAPTSLEQQASGAPQALLSNSILQLYYSPLRSSGSDGLLGESPKLLVGWGVVGVYDMAFTA
jgi:hypothetical protein